MPPMSAMTELTTANLLRVISKNPTFPCNDPSPKPQLTPQVKHDRGAKVKLRISTQRVAKAGTFWNPAHPLPIVMDRVLQLLCRRSGVFQHLKADNMSCFALLTMGFWRNVGAEWSVSSLALSGWRGKRLAPLLRDLEAEFGVRTNLASCHWGLCQDNTSRAASRRNGSDASHFEPCLLESATDFRNW